MADALHQARKNIKALAQQARQVIALDEGLDALNDLQRATEAAAVVRDAAVAAAEQVALELTTARQQLDVANQGIAAAEAKAAEIITVAREQGLSIDREALDKIAQAREQATGIIETASAAAAEIERVKRAELATLDQEIASKRDTLAAINNEIGTAAAALDQVRADRDALVRRLTK